MVNITLITSDPKENYIVRETMTVREFLEEHNVNYSVCSTSIDGIPLRPGDMDKSFQEHNIQNRAVVTCLPNKDNGVSAKIIGSSCVVVSEFTPDQIKRVKKFQPRVMTMVDEEGEPVFAIDIDENMPGSINEYGACFGNATHNGKATITLVLDPAAEDTTELVYEQIGRSLKYLKDMEEQIAEILPELDNEENEIRAMIERV